MLGAHTSGMVIHVHGHCTWTLYSMVPPSEHGIYMCTSILMGLVGGCVLKIKGIVEIVVPIVGRCIERFPR